MFSNFILWIFLVTKKSIMYTDLVIDHYTHSLFIPFSYKHVTSTVTFRIILSTAK